MAPPGCRRSAPDLELLRGVAGAALARWHSAAREPLGWRHWVVIATLMLLDVSASSTLQCQHRAAGTALGLLPSKGGAAHTMASP